MHDFGVAAAPVPFKTCLIARKAYRPSFESFRSELIYPATWREFPAPHRKRIDLPADRGCCVCVVAKIGSFKDGIIKAVGACEAPKCSLQAMGYIPRATDLIFGFIPVITLRDALDCTPLAGDRLMSAFYANELLLRLLPRHDPHPALFDAYRELLLRMRDAADDAVRALRLVEKRLLEELGWGLSLETDAASGEPVQADRCYSHRIDGGAQAVDGVAEGSLLFSGESLLSLAREDLGDPRSLADARRLLRAALEQCLDGRPLRTREVLIAMRAHGGARGG